MLEEEDVEKINKWVKRLESKRRTAAQRKMERNIEEEEKTEESKQKKILEYEKKIAEKQAKEKGRKKSR